MDLTNKQIQVAHLNGFHYIWQLERDDGKIVSQFEHDGEEVALAERFKILPKSPLDKYGDSIVVEGVRRGAWVATVEGLNSMSVDVEKGENLVIYRKSYLGSDSMKYFCYCLGVRREDVETDPVELVYYLCPPTVVLDKFKKPREFKGGITRSKDPLHRNEFDTFSSKL